MAVDKRAPGYEGTDFQVGDLVRLTGLYWEVKGLETLITQVDSQGRSWVDIPDLGAEYLEGGYEATLITPVGPVEVQAPTDYYKGTDVLDFIERHELGFSKGNVVKYVARAGKKPGEDPVKDLKKARDYLDREITRLENTKESK